MLARQQPDPEPTPSWERQPMESARAFEAFKVYRDMDSGERSLHAAYRRYNGYEAAMLAARQITNAAEQATEVERISRTFAKQASGGWQTHYYNWSWKQRAADYDADQEKAYLASRRRDLKQHRGRKVNYGRLLIGRAVPALNGINPQALTLEQALTLLNNGLRLEAEGLGDSLSVPEGLSVAVQEAESYIDRIHRLKAERDARTMEELPDGA